MKKIAYIQPRIKNVVFVPELATAQLAQTSYHQDGETGGDYFGGQIIDDDIPEGQEIDVKKNQLWDEEW